MNACFPSVLLSMFPPIPCFSWFRHVPQPPVTLRVFGVLAAAWFWPAPAAAQTDSGFFGRSEAVMKARNFMEEGVPPQLLKKIAERFGDALDAERQHETEKAIEAYRDIIEWNPKGFAYLVRLGNVYILNRRYAEAISAYNRALEMYPDPPPDTDCRNNLSWMLATCPDDALRDGKRALELAMAAEAAHPESATADTLAAAYAELGDFEKALEWQEIALTRIRRAGGVEDPMLARQDLYKAGKPFRDRPARKPK